MTDGIIQEVFKKKRIPYDRFNIATQMGEFNSAQKQNILLNELEQELIEKIRLEILSCYEQEPYLCARDLLNIQRRLIGDKDD